MKVRIKTGATVFQDFGFFKWPGCKPPKSEFENAEEYTYETRFPDAIFDIKKKGVFDNGRLFLVRPGYGQSGDYGNGVICITSIDDVVVVEQQNKDVE